MVFCFVQKIFLGQHESQNIYFFRRAQREFFFKNLTLGYMTKTLNQIIFFSFTNIRIFFSATLGIRIFAQKKTHNPSPPVYVLKSFPNAFRMFVQTVFILVDNSYCKYKKHSCLTLFPSCRIGHICMIYEVGREASIYNIRL